MTSFHNNSETRETNVPIALGKNILSTLKSKPLHRYYWLICEMLAVTGVYYFANYLISIPNSIDIRLIATVFMLFVWLAHLLVNRDENATVETHTEETVKVLLEIVIAGVFASFLYYIYRPDVKGGTDEEGHKELLIAFVVSISALSLQIVSRAAGLAKGFKEATDAAKETATTIAGTFSVVMEAANNTARQGKTTSDAIADSARKITSTVTAIEAAHRDVMDVALLIKVLTLREKSNVLSSDTAKSAISSAQDNMHVWVTFGENLKSKTQSESWWGLMETYNREERYDIARNEVVTNVRNYAFIILRLIHEQILAAIAHGAESKMKVVVAQVTPFSPKDFYNFPNGSSGNRYYFDQEFFGTYRRLLSYYLRHTKVDVRRVLLGAKSTESERNDLKIRDLGWKLDGPEKLYIACNYMNVLPTAIPVEAKDHISRPKHNLLAFQLISHDPAMKLRADVGDYPWVPVYADGNWKSESALPADVRNRRGFKNIRLVDEETNSDVGIGDYCLSRGPAPYVKGARISDLFLDVTDKEESAWKTLKTNIETDGTTNYSLKKNWDNLETAKGLFETQIMTNVSDEALDSLFQVVPIVQEIDAQLVENNSAAMGQSASNQPIGFAEQWLYWWLVQIEQKLWTVPQNGKLPTVWSRFKRDVLALEEKDSEESRVRLVLLDSETVVSGAVGTTGNSAVNLQPTNSLPYMESNGILPEFVLIGLSDMTDSDDLPNVDWKIFLGAEMSEPFQAVRIMFDFRDNSGGDATPDRRKDLLKQHKDWLTALWNNEGTKTVTKTFIKAINQGTKTDVQAFFSAVDRT